MLSLGLGVMYALEPARQNFLSALSPWADLIGSQSGAGAGLEPDPRLLSNSRPLIDYGQVQFLGCDLALHLDQLSLVTYWSGEVSGLDYEVGLRLNSPNGERLVDVVQPLNATALAFALPDGFYSSSQRGQVWVQLRDNALDRPLTPTLTLRPEADQDWQPICS